MYRRLSSLRKNREKTLFSLFFLRKGGRLYTGYGFKLEAAYSCFCLNTIDVSRDNYVLSHNILRTTIYTEPMENTAQQLSFGWISFANLKAWHTLHSIIKGDVTRDHSKRRFLAQHSVASLLPHCFEWL